MKSLFLLAVMFGICSGSHALEVELFINKGVQISNEVEFSTCAFNATPTLSSVNKNIHVPVGESLILIITNQDTLLHTFTIDGVLENDNTIAPGESNTFELGFSESGTWRYYSSPSYGQLAGASGLILVGFEEFPCYFWNLFDLETNLSHLLTSEDVTEIPSTYTPELFFINGAHFPFTLDNPETLINVGLGDTAIISAVNSGYMDHVIHFHGFHIEVISAQLQTDRVGWIKDTIPLKSGEAMTFRLIANQVGIYPVHDHNLIAVTNLGFYPGGMLTQIHVQP